MLGRRGVVILSALVIVPAAGAVSIVGSERAEVLRGTQRPDVIDGRGGNDTIFGRAGGDFLVGGAGRDRVLGGPGDDRLKGDDGERDSIACGDGTDTVNADVEDAVARDCETIARRIASDTFPPETTPGQHETTVEPDTFAFGSTVVSVFQVGRNVLGGAQAIGYAVSRDAGATWRTGLLPGQTVFSPAPAGGTFASDPSVAYDAVHGTWLAATLVGGPRDVGIAVARSPDGESWSPPGRVASLGAGVTGFDKEWIACDNGGRSPLLGSCYVAYNEFRGSSGRLAVITSSDGGATWSAPATALTGADVIGAQPAVLPDGRLVVVAASLDDRVRPRAIVDVVSTDGGTNFGGETQIAPLTAWPTPELRAPALPSVDVAEDGLVYVVWADCRFSPGCTGNDVVVSSSLDGSSWSTPVRIPGLSGNRFVPGIAAGSDGRLAVVSYGVRPRGCARELCLIDAQLVVSRTGGATWKRPVLLSAQSMQLDWLAVTNQGLMLGDYLSVSFAGTRAVTVLPLASARSPDGDFEEAMYAVSVAF